MTIHRRYRICRRHFDSDCLNGGCRRLLNTAVPTLHLESEAESVRIDGSGNLTVRTIEPEVVYLAVGEEHNEIDEHFELVEAEQEKSLIEKVEKVKGNHLIMRFMNECNDSSIILLIKLFSLQYCIQMFNLR